MIVKKIRSSPNANPVYFFYVSQPIKVICDTYIISNKGSEINVGRKNSERKF